MFAYVEHAFLYLWIKDCEESADNVIHSLSVAHFRVSSCVGDQNIP